MTEPKICCDACEYTHYQTDEFDRGVGLITECRNSKCECHTPESDKVQRGNCVFCGPVQGFSSMGDDIEIIHENHKRFHTPVSEPQVGFLRQYLNESPDWKGKKFTDEDLLSFLRVAHTPTPPDTRPAYLWDKEAKDVARTVGNMIRENEGTTPTPPPTGRTDEQNKAILDHARPLIEGNRRLLGLDTTPPPTGNYFQYRADPNEKKLEFDAPPTEGWEERFDRRFTADWWMGFGSTDDINRVGIGSIKAFITQALAEQKALHDKHCKEQYDLGHAHGVEIERARMVEEVGNIKELEHEGSCGSNDWDCLYEGCRYSLQNETIEHIIKALSK